MCFAWSFTKNGSLSYVEAKNKGREKRRSSPTRFLFSLSSASLQHKKGFGCGGEREWLTTKNGLPSGSLALFRASSVEQKSFFVARGGMLRARHTGEMLALRASGNSFNFHDFESLVLYAAVYPGVYRAFSLTWPASMQTYMNKRNCLRKERVQLPRD